VSKWEQVYCRVNILPILIISAKTDNHLDTIRFDLKGCCLIELCLKAGVKYLLYNSTISVAKNHNIRPQTVLKIVSLSGYY